MEEDIKEIEDILKNKDTKFWIGTNGIQVLENLIKVYRELEEKAEVAEWKLQHAYNTGWKACEIISIQKSKIKEILDRLNISDIEPYSTYQVSGDILFDLEKMLGE